MQLAFNKSFKSVNVKLKIFNFINLKSGTSFTMLYTIVAHINFSIANEIINFNAPLRNYGTLFVQG